MATFVKQDDEGFINLSQCTQHKMDSDRHLIVFCFFDNKSLASPSLIYPTLNFHHERIHGNINEQATKTKPTNHNDEPSYKSLIVILNIRCGFRSSSNCFCSITNHWLHVPKHQYQYHNSRPINGISAHMHVIYAPELYAGQYNLHHFVIREGSMNPDRANSRWWWARHSCSSMSRRSVSVALTVQPPPPTTTTAAAAPAVVS